MSAGSPRPRSQDRRGGHSQRGRPDPGRAGRRGGRPATRRSRTPLFTWGSVALALVVVIVVVVVSRTDGETPASKVHYTPEPVPASIVREITHVPASSYDAVGAGLPQITTPSVVSTQPALVLSGKPGLFGLFGEFCPFCAAERWSVITSLARFGTFTGIKTMQSSPVDTDPRTQTFEFATATYSSPYVSAALLEMFGQDKPTGTHPVIHDPSKLEEHLIEKYDTGSTSSGTIPFFDVGNKVIFSGASYTPAVLKGLSRATIAADLSHPTNPVTELVLGTSNYLSAGICSIDGDEPGAVCTSAGVRAAAKKLDLGHRNTAASGHALRGRRSGVR